MALGVWAGMVPGLTACTPQCPPPASPPPQTCTTEKLPLGRWTGEWESSPLSQPDFKRSGTIDLVVAENGKLLGETIEHYSGHAGTLKGTAFAGGEFAGEYLVSRDGVPKSYKLKVSFACQSGGLAGKGIVMWGEGEQGNLTFFVQQPP